MPHERLRQVLDWLKRVITQPQSELTRWQATVRFAYDLGRYGAIQLREDRAPQMAAALAYRTLFGLLPLLVVGTIFVRAMGGFAQFRETVQDFLEGMTGEPVAGDGDAAVGIEEAARSLQEWLLDLIGQVENINLAAIGWVGAVVLCYSVISLMVTIEGCFNGICRAPEGRSWTRRVPVYWFVVCFAPAAIYLTVFVDRQFEALVADLISWRWILVVAPVMWSFLASWLLMFVVYKLLPNTTVRTHPAVIGAFVAAVLLEVGKRTMGAYLENALTIRYLYGSLGLIPLFMFWVYIMWLVILFGLEVSATLQMLAGRSIDEVEHRRRQTGLVDPASILLVMEVAAERFRDSVVTTDREIVDETGLTAPTVDLMLRRLVEAGFLHRVDREENAFSLARPPERIVAADLIQVGFDLVDEGGIGRKPDLLKRLRDAQHQLAEQATLAQLLPPAPVVATGDQVRSG